MAIMEMGCENSGLNVWWSSFSSLFYLWIIWSHPSLLLDDIGWSPAPEGTDSAPDVYRSVAGLPRDLEYLLKKAEDDNLGGLLISK